MRVINKVSDQIFNLFEVKQSLCVDPEHLRSEHSEMFRQRLGRIKFLPKAHVYATTQI